MHRIHCVNHFVLTLNFHKILLHPIEFIFLSYFLNKKDAETEISTSFLQLYRLSLSHPAVRSIVPILLSQSAQDEDDGGDDVHNHP